jgi:hypothetical protein
LSLHDGSTAQFAGLSGLFVGHRGFNHNQTGIGAMSRLHRVVSPLTAEGACLPIARNPGHDHPREKAVHLVNAKAQPIRHARAEVVG